MKLTKRTWARCVARLKSYFTGSFKLDKMGIQSWYELLSDYPDNIVEEAVQAVARTCKSFPVPKDIIDAAEALMAEPGDGTWAECWAHALEICHLFTHPVWSHEKGEHVYPGVGEMTSRVVEQFGGWRKIAMMEDSQIGMYRAQFRDVYNSIKNKRRVVGEPRTNLLTGQGAKILPIVKGME